MIIIMGSVTIRMVMIDLWEKSVEDENPSSH